MYSDNIIKNTQVIYNTQNPYNLTKPQLGKSDAAKVGVTDEVAINSDALHRIDEANKIDNKDKSKGDKVKVAKSNLDSAKKDETYRNF